MTKDDRIVDAVERLVVEAVGVTTVALEQAAPDVELSLTQWRTLVVVSSAGDDGLRVGELAARIGSTGPSTSRLVRRLERRGLVLAQRDEADRRATLVSLTADGRRIRNAIVEHRRELVRAALSALPGPLGRDVADDLAQIAAALHAYE
jgi:DNA-binding MarR family transcriptional regulator